MKTLLLSDYVLRTLRLFFYLLPHVSYTTSRITVLHIFYYTKRRP